MFRCRIVLIGLTVLVAVGCSDSQLVEATGTLTYRGKPVANANILCQSSGGITATGATDEQGHFKDLSTSKPGDGVVPGEYKVAVTPQTAAPDETEAASYDEPPAPPFPTKYLTPDTSDLNITVTADGPNRFNLELKD